MNPQVLLPQPIDKLLRVSLAIKLRVQNVRRLQLNLFQFFNELDWCSACPALLPHPRRNQVGPISVRLANDEESSRLLVYLSGYIVPDLLISSFILFLII